MAEGGGKQPDMRMVMAVVFMGLVAVLTFTSDTYTFVKKPPTFVEKLLALPSLLGYKLLQDRVAADAAAFIFFLIVVGFVGFGLWKLFVRNVLEHWEAKEYWRRRTRRQDLLDKYM